MLVCAVSDLHGRLPLIPECDVLLIAGDLCPDEYPTKQTFSGWTHDIAHKEQREWLHDVYALWEESVPAEHIFVTGGNHDWITKFPDELRSRFFIDEGVELYDGPKMIARIPMPLGTSILQPVKRFYFTPWVPVIGNWNYQLPRDQRALRFADIPDKLDVLVSHGPAHDVLDKVHGAYGDHVGCPELRKFVQQRQPRFMVHGHIHEGQRYGNRAQLGNTTVYNVAQWGDWKPTVFEI